MTIQSNLKKEITEIKYPFLGADGGFVVLFTKPGAGVTLTSDLHRDPGYYYEGWDMSYFKPLQGTIELSNAL